MGNTSSDQQKGDRSTVNDHTTTVKDSSSGFHIIEIHAQTMTSGIFFLLFIIGILALFFYLYRRYQKHRVHWYGDGHSRDHYQSRHHGRHRDYDRPREFEHRGQPSALPALSHDNGINPLLPIQFGQQQAIQQFAAFQAAQQAAQPPVFFPVPQATPSAPTYYPIPDKMVDKATIHRQCQSSVQPST